MTVQRFLLDTSIAIEMLRGRRPDLRKQFNAHVDELATSSVVVSELLYGVHRSTTPERLKRQVDWLIQLVTVLDFDEPAAAHAAEIRADLAVLGTPIGAYDILIAGYARSRGLVVVTQNGKHFARVPGLRHTDWR